NIMMVPLAADDRRTKGAGRVHGRAGVRASEENIEHNREADGQAADFRRADIDSGAINHKDQEKGQHGLNPYTLNASRSFTQGGSALGDQFLSRDIRAPQQ